MTATGEKGTGNSMLRGEQLCADHDGGFADSGVFFVSVVDFEFVEVFEMWISDFRFAGGQRAR